MRHRVRRGAIAMLRKLIFAAAIVVVSTGWAQAQYSGPYAYQETGGTNFNLFPDYEGKRSYGDVQRDRVIEEQYRATVNARIPDKKPSNDPWKTIRPAATATPAQPASDRHRPM
jgi:hypothetical protein